MTPDQQSAYVCLAEGGYVIDPIYAENPKKQEAKLKADCRRCWKYREAFPEWIKKLIAAWKTDAPAKPEVDRAERLSGESVEPEAIPGIQTGTTGVG